MNYQKLLVLGLAAIISTNVFAHNPAEQSIERLTEHVHALQQKNIVPKVNVNYVVKPAEEINKNHVHGVADFKIYNENCSVDIEVNPNMETSYIGSSQNRTALKEITDPSNSKQHEIRTGFITYHEMAHCRFHEIKDSFKAEDKNFEQVLNQFFKYGEASSNSSISNKLDSSLHSSLQENFADAFSTIQLIKKYGADKDLLITIQKVQIERTDSSNTFNKEALISHNTGFTVSEILKEENIKKILATDNEKELEEMALNIANKGMWKSIKTYGNAHQVSNQDTLEDGAYVFFSSIALKNIKVQDLKEKNLNVDFSDNALYQTAKETYDILNNKLNLNSIKDEKGLEEVFFKHQQEIRDLLSDNLYKKITIMSGKGINVFEVVEKHLETVDSGQKQNLEEIKANGKEALKNAEILAKKLSTNSVLKNMSSFRQAHLHNHNKTVHIKYGQ